MALVETVVLLHSRNIPGNAAFLQPLAYCSGNSRRAPSDCGEDIPEAGRRVLTMEFIQARPVSDYFDAEAFPQEVRSKLATIGANATLKQIFTYGFFHADPHPGNITVIDDRRIFFLDFGLTGNLVQRDLEVFSDILIGLISRDDELARSIERETAELISQFQGAQAGDCSLKSFAPGECRVTRSRLAYRQRPAAMESF